MSETKKDRHVARQLTMDAIRANGHRGCGRPSGGQDYCDDPEASTAGESDLLQSSSDAFEVVVPMCMDE